MHAAITITKRMIIFMMMAADVAPTPFERWPFVMMTREREKLCVFASNPLDAPFFTHAHDMHTRIHFGFSVIMWSSKLCVCISSNNHETPAMPCNACCY